MKELIAAWKAYREYLAKNSLMYIELIAKSYIDEVTQQRYVDINGVRTQLGELRNEATFEGFMDFISNFNKTE